MNQAHKLLRSLFLPEEVTRLLPASASAGGSGQASPHEDPKWACDLAWLEMSTYMRNVLLRDTDCMCMANSLELRVPYLDNGVVDFVMSLPIAVRSRRKRLIVDAYRDLLPPEVIGRRKQGFGLPIGPWMASDLHDVVAVRLSDPPEALRPLFDSAAVQNVWGAFEATSRRWLRPWSLFALFTWWAAVEAEARASGY
jgi:asparagine synthase (glutamine-hydrolysing)